MDYARAVRLKKMKIYEEKQRLEERMHADQKVDHARQHVSDLRAEQEIAFAQLHRGARTAADFQQWARYDEALREKEGLALHQLEECVDEANQASEAVFRAYQDVYRFRQLAELERSRLQKERLSREWHALDEWVLNRSVTNP
ncbi:hypothetical protein [Ferroacidibacillus organovorans]|uniref:Uncharacterized protein n=1 Tax=Ferroacidibacillus organovorans TaxID=1765683 RepID=A0A853KDM0_9BACL|nr:hypothetical protein [Ferroacidibacillus organovorans]KYP82155.1 hypothetical protein AYJ22_00435 [Ferroacidibacillus organovorans]OAG94438.1 hypothetical protein AYW79_05325 [Ferroacidibacillus organovorans]